MNNGSLFFLETISAYLHLSTGEKYAPLLQLVNADATLSKESQVPKIFLEFSGEQTTLKLKALNVILMDWQAKSVMHKLDPATKCP